MIREYQFKDKEAIAKIGLLLESDFINKINFDNLNDKSYSKMFVFEEKSVIIGFINFYLLYETAEIIYLAVSKDYQCRGIGSELVKHMINICSNNKVNSITLEVRSSNHKAISLYTKYGFKEINLRKNYYQNEDGILMELIL